VTPELPPAPAVGAREDSDDSEANFNVIAGVTGAAGSAVFAIPRVHRK
jgi:hypothetical protein